MLSGGVGNADACNICFVKPSRAGSVCLCLALTKCGGTPSYGVFPPLVRVLAGGLIEPKSSIKSSITGSLTG